MSVLDKLKRMSKKQTFDDMPDMRKNGALEALDLKRVANECSERIISQGKEAGYENIEVKVVAVGVYLMVLDPNDITRQNAVLSPMVVADKEIAFEEMMRHHPLLRDSDATKTDGKSVEDEDYQAGNYEGHMYG
jgi:hypothetical protein